MKRTLHGNGTCLCPWPVPEFSRFRRRSRSKAPSLSTSGSTTAMITRPIQIYVCRKTSVDMVVPPGESDEPLNTLSPYQLFRRSDALPGRSRHPVRLSVSLYPHSAGRFALPDALANSLSPLPVPVHSLSCPLCHPSMRVCVG